MAAGGASVASVASKASSAALAAPLQAARPVMRVMRAIRAMRTMASLCAGGRRAVWAAEAAALGGHSGGSRLPPTTAVVDASSGIRVVYEDKARGLLVIDKPPGIPFHRRREALPSDDQDEYSEEDDEGEIGDGDNGDNDDNGDEGEVSGVVPANQKMKVVEDGLMQHLRRMQLEGLIEHKGKLFPVHRLDRVTSGIIVVATTPEAAASMGRAFEEHRVQKYYVALSDRFPSKLMGTVSGDMQRSRRSGWMITRTKKRPAVTKYVSTKLKLTKTIQDDSVDDTGDGNESKDRAQTRTIRAFLIKPETGKTHQIRVALKSVGSPILGDVLYGEARHAKRQDRTYLHACGIKVDLGDGNGPMQVIVKPSHGSYFSATTDGNDLASSGFSKIWEEFLLPAMIVPGVKGSNGPTTTSRVPSHLARLTIGSDDSLVVG